jgi:acyl-CoA synthetase (AMP-forming)/AMP-acid ligase II
MAAGEAESFVELLERRGAATPGREAFRFLVEDGEMALSYAELAGRARGLAATLAARAERGERVLLLLPKGLDFVAAFFACLYAGLVAVPAYPPRRARGRDRLDALALDVEPRVVLTAAASVERIRHWAAELPWEPPAVLAIEELSCADGPPPSLPAPDDLAFLQYTSGSTAEPKGVMVTHRSLMANEAVIGRAFGQHEGSVIVSWLPLYHDMGLIGGVLQPVYAGARCVLLSPVSFLQRPRRWLEAVSHFRATTSGGPDFAYDLCVRKIGQPQRQGLDLSSWSVAFNGSEPVRAETLDRFGEAFAGCGFDRRAFYPCYGLAEATLFVAGGSVEAEPVVAAVSTRELARDGWRPAATAADARRLVGCGGAWEGHRLAIVDPVTGRACPPGRNRRDLGERAERRRGLLEQAAARRAEQTSSPPGRLRDNGAGARFLRTGDLGVFAGATSCS